MLGDMANRFLRSSRSNPWKGRVKCPSFLIFFVNFLVLGWNLNACFFGVCINKSDACYSFLGCVFFGIKDSYYR
jgi:hypothetical protein